MKHIVCYSGGHSSARVAIEVVKRYGKDNVILLNHDISKNVEDSDIKRFKNEISRYLGINITYANMTDFDVKDQFVIALEEKAFTIGVYASCTKKLKTEPFYKYLTELDCKKEEVTIYYGFDKNEEERIKRREFILKEAGYKTEYPIAYWDNIISSTEEIGIIPPLSYSNYKHANCKGCLKGGSQHWYVVYCLNKDIFDKAKATEEQLGYSIIKGKYLKDVECDFYRMKQLGVVPTEHKQFQTFWKEAKDKLRQPNLFNYDKFEKSCECSVL